MNYHIKKPIKLLQPWIECYWQVQLNTGDFAKKETILPNGKIEMIFALEGNYQVGNRKTYRMKQAWLSGIQREPLHIAYKGVSNLIGVRFYPNGLFPFLPIPISETINEVEPLSLLWGSFADEVFESLCSTDNIEEIFTKLDYYLLYKLSPRKEANHQLVKTIIREQQIQPSIMISELASKFGYSERQLNRIFKDQTGISPKIIAQIYRFEKSSMFLFKHAINEDSNDLLDLGYYDQSHFIKEFKRFSGMTPEEYKRKAIVSNNFL
ncbi:helix-turn-helix domain-containing protein [Sutcliffiella halmapala]|uniref:helix-turn-helix domain-containing protein n=1 Tax=Sutcliffiella halmapala TaxID=79882 RepID=UPI0009956A85|nr:helix-turn-helix domain-containing protein [Sutcliffiella halmapala]